MHVFRRQRLFSLLSLPALLFMIVGVVSQETVDPALEAVALFTRGQDAHANGDLRAALELYAQALKLLPEFPEAELQSGQAQLSLGRLEEAERSFRRAVALRDDWSLAYAYLGTLLVKREKYQEAESVLTKAIELDADNFPAYAAITTLRLRSGVPQSQLKELYSKVAAITTNANPTASIWAARASLESAFGETKAAKASAAKALELDGRNTAMLALSASIAIDENDVRAAEAMIKRIETIEPAAPELPVLRATAMLKQGKIEEAKKNLDAVEKPGRDVIALRQKIAAATTTDVNELEKLLAANPSDVTVLSRLCSTLRSKEPGKALEHCRRASELEPENIDHAIGYGGALIYLKQYPSAATLFERLAKAAPENTTVRANLGTALFQAKRYNEAKVQFAWLTERQPKLAPAYFFLAVSHDQLGEYADAMANYQQFLKLADAGVNKLEIDKVNLRLPTLQKQLDKGKGRNKKRT